jgi:hypothetical protein
MFKKFTAKENYIVGVISDTHGRLPKPVLTIFKDLDLIVHAGDIGKQEILESLAQIAPVIAVRGNMDMGNWANQLPENEVVQISQMSLCVIHDVTKINLIPDTNRCQILVSGHTHRPMVKKSPEVLSLNPGSAAQPRYGYPASVGLLRIKGKVVKARLIELKE